MTKDEIMIIYDTYFTCVFCHIDVLIEEPHKSMEIASEVFISLYKLKSPVIGDNNTKCFLLTTARNMALSYLKNKLHHV